jgi:hypothetical protein
MNAEITRAVIRMPRLIRSISVARRNGGGGEVVIFAACAPGSSGIVRAIWSIHVSSAETDDFESM